MGDETIPGGWRVPAELLYTLGEPGPPIEFPRVEVPREGIRWHSPTPEETAAREAYTALVGRLVDAWARQRRAVIDAACATALVEGWDVHVYDPPLPFTRGWLHGSESTNDLRARQYVGIKFTSARYAVPTLIEHPWDDAYADLDDDEWGRL